MTDVPWAVQTYSLGSYSICHFQKGIFFIHLWHQKDTKGLNSTLKTQPAFKAEAFVELHLMRGSVVHVDYARQKSFICLKPKVIMQQVTLSTQSTQMNSTK